MSDYAALQADVADWLVRSDLSVQIPTFIRLAEGMHARDVRVYSMMQRRRAIGTGERYLAFPDNFLEARRLWIVDGEKLMQVTPDALEIRSGGLPRTYCTAREIELDSPISDEVTVEMIYYAPFTALSAPTDTNWLLDNAYDAYLYGSLVAAEPYLRNDERVALWSAGYRAAIEALNLSDARGRIVSAGQGFRIARSAGATP